MKKNLFLMLGLGAMLLTSCDQDIVNEIYLPGGGGSVVVTDSTSTKQLQVFTNLEMLQPAVSTRASSKSMNIMLQQKEKKRFFLNNGVHTSSRVVL